MCRQSQFAPCFAMTLAVAMLIAIVMVIAAASAGDPPVDATAASVTTHTKIKGGISHSPEDYLVIAGHPRVIDGETLVFEDGTVIDISGGMEAPPLEANGLLGGTLYPCGREAAGFLTSLIGDKTVTCYVNSRFGKSEGHHGGLRGSAYVGEMRLDEAMIRGGWAVSDHSGTVPAELIARENQRGLWRGKFVAPREWRKGARLPGEPPVALPPPAEAPKAPAPAPKPPTIVRDGETIIRITGNVTVLDAHSLRFADGTELELNGGIDAPDLDQPAMIGDGLYPWGRQAADFLRQLIGDQPVTCYVEGMRGQRYWGACFVNETSLEIELVREGWALSHHTGMDGWQWLARDNKRHIWRGTFLEPERWRRGERLPAEAAEIESERAPLAALERFNPIVTHDPDRRGRTVIAIAFRPNTDKPGDDDLAELKHFHNLRSIDLPSASKVTDAGLGHLAELPQLEELNVNWTKVTAAGVLQLVKNRRGMKRLEVAGVNFRDEDMAALKELWHLKTLSLRATQVTDQGLEHLKPFTELRTLSLMSTSIGDAGLAHLESLTMLEDLDLDRTAITDAGLEHLSGLHDLRRLQMAHTAVTGAHLDALAGLTSLKQLNLRGNDVPPEALAKLKERIPGLEIGAGPAPK
jgi:endonuclease YncB( thermonuclease family)